MKKLLATIFVFSLLIPRSLAWEYSSVEDRLETTGQLRLDFTYTQPLRHGFSLVFFEDLRFDLLPMSYATVFDMSLTSVTLNYSPIKYLKLDAAYMLKILGASSVGAWDTYWLNPNNYIKHRLYVSLTGSYSTGNWRFALRERALCDMRFDEFDPLTAQQYAFTLRHFLNISYNIRSHSLTPYVWTELANTLNATEYTQLNQRQYLERWRNCVGVRYKLPTADSKSNKSRGTLNFFYRYDYGYFRTAKLSGESVALTVRHKHEHAIGIGYEL